MGDAVVLRFQYKGMDVDVVVDDVDKAMLIDLVIEYQDEANKKKVPTPIYPCFIYLHEMKHVQLKTDQDLLQMFRNLARNLIYIWVQELSEPDDLVNAVKSLRSSKGVDIPASNHPQPSFQIHRRSPRLRIEEPVIEPNANPSVALSIDMPPIQVENDDAICHSIEEKWADIVLEPFQSEHLIATPERGRGRVKGKVALRGKGRGRGKGSTQPHLDSYESTQQLHPSLTSPQPGTMPLPLRSPRVHNDFALVQQISEAEFHSVLGSQSLHDTGEGDSLKTSKLSGIQSKRIPRTTAARKGLLVKNNNNNISSKRQTVATNLSGVLQVHGNLHLHDDDEDEGYNPEINTDEIEDSDESLVSEHEPAADIIPEIQDNFDPYHAPHFEQDLGDKLEVPYLQKLYQNGELYNEEEFGKITLRPWMLFIEKSHLRSVVRDYCIQCGFSLVVEKASNTRYTVRCSASNCSWRLHASRLADGMTWAIKSIQNTEHSCMGLEIKNPMVTCKWVKEKLIDDIRANNDISAKSLNELLWQRYGVQMCQSTLYKMRSEALIEIHGGHDVSYSFLPAYCEVVKQTNPNSHAFCAWKPQNHPEKPLAFNTIFIAFKGALDGLFAGCRSLIGVDGAHLKGNFGGVLLSAVALDGNNELFPFAWAIVSSEDTESWKFFVWHLKHALEGSGRGDNWCVISDRQKGIDSALADLWPRVDRRYYCKHLYKNWKNPFPGPLMHNLFWKACGATSTFTFKKAMQQLQKVNHTALVWLSKLGDQSRWSKHKFNPNIKCDVNKTNFVESFNATLGIDRCRPVLTLLEGIRRVTMVRLATRRQACESWERDDICPNIIKRVQTLCHESRTCKALLSGEGQFEILDGRSVLPVNLRERTCACNLWQISGIPCKHGMRAILHANDDPHRYVSNWYTVSVYKMAYTSNIKPIPDQEQWPEVDLPHIQPPSMKRGIGRPSRNRKRDADEERKGKRSKTVQCSKCKSFGHNAKTCKGGLTGREQREGITTEVHKKQQSKKKKSIISSSQPTTTATVRRSTRQSASQPV